MAEKRNDPLVGSIKAEKAVVAQVAHVYLFNEPHEGVVATGEFLKSPVTPTGNELVQRKALSSELYENCKRWSEVLLKTFRKAVKRWSKDGRDAAAREIMQQEEDFMKLDYLSLASTSPLLLFLKQDAKFRAFADACAQFYKSALDVKRLVYGNIERYPSEYVTVNDVGIDEMVRLWEQEVEKMFREVTVRYHEIKTIVG